MIVGDPNGIGVLYAALEPFGARESPEYGDGFYTRTSTDSIVLPIGRRTTF
jgi:hypothetical protein